MDMETSTTEWPPEHETPSTVRGAARATAANRKYAQSFCWQCHLPRIAKLLGVTATRPDDKRLVPAVEAWQRRHGLHVDGIIGPDTWREMRPKLTRPVTRCGKDASYEELLRCIAAELLRKVREGDPAVRRRRQTLRDLFRQIPSDRARDLHDRLRLRVTEDELSCLFHQRLAKGARDELLNILNRSCIHYERWCRMVWNADPSTILGHPECIRYKLRDLGR